MYCIGIRKAALLGTILLNIFLEKMKIDEKVGDSKLKRLGGDR